MDADRPPAITAIEPDPRRPGAVQLLVAGQLIAPWTNRRWRASARVRRWSAAGRRAGQGGRRRGSLPHGPSGVHRRSHARADLARRMVRRGHAPRRRRGGARRAEQHGFLDDEAFAAHYVQTRSERGGARPAHARSPRPGRRPADHRPGRRGALAARRRSTVVPTALAARRAAQMGDLPRPVKRRRLLAFLARRGFSGSEAVEAVEKAL